MSGHEQVSGRLPQSKDVVHDPPTRNLSKLQRPRLSVVREKRDCHRWDFLFRPSP